MLFDFAFVFPLICNCNACGSLGEVWYDVGGPSAPVQHFVKSANYSFFNILQSGFKAFSFGFNI